MSKSKNQPDANANPEFDAIGDAFEPTATSDVMIDIMPQLLSDLKNPKNTIRNRVYLTNNENLGANTRLMRYIAFDYLVKNGEIKSGKDTIKAIEVLRDNGGYQRFIQLEEGLSEEASALAKALAEKYGKDLTTIGPPTKVVPVGLESY